ncbi:Uncharacterized protein BM_BM13619 [Brugia malayi]|uniref:DUF7758 domain-containing protein n=2 Tax=Brugia malayi TaxID=6279 RepID=A0A4E9FNA6_BRUMA|nr:Uncharacterized protein BM_BM13619 [Brugia malayi]VIO97792.1 Uncharacterized protein BM_BM13619 [Brugia malayi]
MKVHCTLCGLCFRRLRKYEISIKQCLCTPLLRVIPEAKKICRLRIKSSPDSAKPIKHLISKLNRKATNELERMKRKGNNWSANDLFKFQHGNLDHYDTDEKRAICMEWLRRLNNITKKYYCLAWYASAIYTCYYRLAPLISDKDEKKRIWIDVKREYAEIFLMGRRIWRRPTHPNRLRILYDLAMLCILFNDIPNDETVILFRDLLDDSDNFNFEVLNEIEYAQSIDKTVRLENHIIDLFYQRRKSTCSTRSSFLSKSNIETPRSSFRSLKMKNDDLKNVKLSKTLSIPENIMSDSCVTTKVIRKQSVRFAGKSDLSKNEEKYLNLTNITTAKSINTNFMENNRTENINKQMNCKQFITSNVFFTEATKIEIEFAMKKKSNHATISQKFPSVLSEQMIAFVVV